MNSENLYGKLQHILGKLPDNFTILEERIDIGVQVEYFERSHIQKTKEKPNDILVQIALLYDNSVSEEEKKDLLVKLGNLEEVAAYRALEKYVNEAQGTIRQWAVLALQENRMLLESTLLDKNQIFISTGMGGKDKKLRYFIVFLHADFQTFSEVQKKILRGEIEFVFQEFDAEAEKILFDDFLCMLVAVIPLNYSVDKLFRKIIFQSNELGNFLKTEFMLTNVREFSGDEVKQLIATRKS